MNHDRTRQPTDPHQIVGPARCGASVILGHELACRDIDYAEAPCSSAAAKGAKNRYVPIGERGLFWLRLYSARAGIQKRGSCHLLRHTVATLMLEGGADIRCVEMLGHTRLETTQRYTRVSIDRLRTVHASAHPAAGLGVATARNCVQCSARRFGLGHRRNVTGPPFHQSNLARVPHFDVAISKWGMPPGCRTRRSCGQPRLTREVIHFRS
jgi:hypothetical protein